MRRRGLAICVVVGWLAAPSPALAICYEDVGCTDTDRFSAADLQRLAECDILWEMRNGIFHEHKYCFQTPKAVEHFGNAGCLYDNADSVPLDAIERDNIATIKSVEQRKGCSE